MRKTVSQIIFRLLTVSVALLSSCAKEEQFPDPVDLKFKAEDSYNLTAQSPELISFIVKSSDEWEVYSYHPEWCEISPSTGTPGEKFTVEVQYSDNTELDDRVDTLVIKSDYWIGKWITVNQKGIAFLDVSEWKDELAKSSSEGKVEIRSNQKWTAEVVDGESWLRITGGSQGEGDGTVMFAASDNKGERRKGQIAVYDRHDREIKRFEVIQNGVQLDPEALEVRALYNETSVSLHVVSNTQWKVRKDDTDQEWYSFSQQEFSGDGVLEISLQRNESTSLLRKAEFTLETKSTEDGVSPVIRKIVLKQAYNNVPQRHYFNESEAKSWTLDRGKCSITPEGVSFTEKGRYRRSGLANGTYSFKISSMSPDAGSQIHFTYGETGSHEMRWHVDGDVGKTHIGVSPYVKEFKQVKIDISKPNILTLALSEAPGGFVKAEWLLNGVLIDVLETSEVKPVDIRWDAPITMFVGSKSGTVVYEYYEYTGPIIWD